MLFLIFGSSGAGKSVVLSRLRGRIAGVAVHDFDELGVPSGADTAWRQRSNERWIHCALEYQQRGIDVLLGGQTPLGELLATPSAPLLEAVSACLLDCDDETRKARLTGPGAGSRNRAAAHMDAYLKWAAWLRGHARDPSWHPEVIRDSGSLEMRWERWTAWQADDPRWRVRVIDTSTVPVAHVADELVVWIEEERSRRQASTRRTRGIRSCDDASASLLQCNPDRSALGRTPRQG